MAYEVDPLTFMSSSRDTMVVASLVFFAACFESEMVGVRTVDTIRVTPATVSMPIGQSVVLQAIVVDEFGVAFAGLPLRWSSEDEGTAVVTQSGSVTGLARGVAKIFVAANQVVGSADVEVTGPPVITLVPASASFSGVVNSQNPQPQIVTVTNTGEGSIGDLTLGPVSYGTGQQSGWLTAELQTQPLSLVLRVVTAGLPVGVYSAELSVEGGDATNTPLSFPVSLQITP